MAVAAIVLLSATASYFFNTYSLAQEQALDSSPRLPRAAGAAAGAAVPLALPSFDASILPAAIERASTSAQISADEFAFVLEDGAGVPYRRYRASMRMTGRYPQIRAAVKGILEQLPYGALDAMSCARADIVDSDMTCGVTVSTFYRREQS